MFFVMLVLFTINDKANSSEYSSNINILQTYTENPRNNDIYIFENQVVQGVEWRQKFKFKALRKIKVQIQPVLSLYGASDDEILAKSIEESIPNRSPKLGIQLKKKETILSRAVLEKFSASGYRKGFSWKIGRMPIDLSKSWIFRPNDLFGPYGVTQIDRTYKPGVDVGAASYSIGDQSTVSILGIIGYCDYNGKKSNQGSSGKPCPAYSSALTTYTTSLLQNQIDLFIGRLGERNVLGNSIQGDIFSWLAFYFELHSAQYLANSYRYQTSVLGFNIRIFDSLLMQFEYFNNGQGYTNIDSYNKEDNSPQAPKLYLADQYIGIGLNYEMSNQTKLTAQLQANLLDNSRYTLVGLAHEYNINSEITINLGLPSGKKPEESTSYSEFGSYPIFFNINSSFYL